MAGLKKLRSQRWLANEDFRSFNHRSRVMQMGYDRKDWEGLLAMEVEEMLRNWTLTPNWKTPNWIY